VVGSCAVRTPDQTRPCRDPTIVIKLESNWFFSKKKNRENQETGLVLNLKKINHGFLNTVRSLPENEEWEMRVQRVMERQR
jgi:hypothetical protein